MHGLQADSTQAQRVLQLQQNHLLPLRTQVDLLGWHQNCKQRMLQLQGNRESEDHRGRVHQVKQNDHQGYQERSW